MRHLMGLVLVSLLVTAGFTTAQAAPPLVNGLKYGACAEIVQMHLGDSVYNICLAQGVIPAAQSRIPRIANQVTYQNGTTSDWQLYWNPTTGKSTMIYQSLVLRAGFKASKSSSGCIPLIGCVSETAKMCGRLERTYANFYDSAPLTPKFAKLPTIDVLCQSKSWNLFDNFGLNVFKSLMNFSFDFAQAAALDIPLRPRDIILIDAPLTGIATAFTPTQSTITAKSNHWGRMQAMLAPTSATGQSPTVQVGDTGVISRIINGVLVTQVYQKTTIAEL